ncbi:MAG: peptidoglycan-binding domain-containing protein [bacterium]|nr:peptidoglycan-binding domain-containing protein [bacterium]
MFHHTSPHNFAMKMPFNPLISGIFFFSFFSVFVVPFFTFASNGESVKLPSGVPLLAGCASNYGFSVVNGLPCSDGSFASASSGSDSDDATKPALIPGCANSYGFSIFNGQSCAGKATKQDSFLVPGVGVYLGGWGGWNGPVSTVKSVKIYFARPLDIGSSGYDVRLLQTFLAKDKELYPEGYVNGYFGLNTARAVGRLQLRHGLVKSNAESTYGFVGPKTRALLNSLQ